MYVRPNFRRRKIAAAIAGVIALAVSHQASAAIVVLNSVSGEATAGESSANSAYDFPQAPGYISGNASDSFAPVDQANAASWVNTNNAFAAGASGEGNFEATARLLRNFVVTNDLGAAAQGTIGFYIYGGQLFTSLLEGSMGSGSASYELDILIDGISRFSSTASLDEAGNVLKSGTELSNAMQGGGAYFWSPTQLSFDLGVLAPGQSVTIDYSLVTTAIGNYGQLTTTTTGNCGGYGYGDGGYGYGGYGYGGSETGCCASDITTLDAVSAECVTTQAGGRSSAFLGDPSDLMLQEMAEPPTTAQTTVSLRRVTDVPAPGGLALLLGAIGAAALRRRRTQ